MNNNIFFPHNTFYPTWSPTGQLNNPNGNSWLKDAISSVWNSSRDLINGNTESKFQQNFLNQQMEFNKQQAEINRQFQLEMSNTAYQRMAQDLKKAGFNPALVLNGGGASTPSGSLATSSLATAPSVTASSVALKNNKLNATTAMLNNLITNGFNWLNTQTKASSQMSSAFMSALSSFFS